MTKRCERYLTREHKVAILAEWDAKIITLPSDSAGGPDAAVVPWCARLNAIQGVCTLQSCAGHIENGYLHSGHIWLWLDQAKSVEWDRRAYELAAARTIERVTRIYSSWGQEVHCVEFQGEERGCLAESMKMIEWFVTSRIA